MNYIALLSGNVPVQHPELEKNRRRERKQTKALAESKRGGSHRGTR